MSVKQISVFLENRPGALAEMTHVLAQAGIDMRAFSLAESSDFGIARIIADDVFQTTTVLRDAGYINSVTPVLAATIPDEPGGLSRVLDILKDSGINVEYMYAFLSTKKPGTANMIFRVGDHKAAARALAEHGIHPMTHQEELAD